MFLNLWPNNCEYRGEGNTALVISLKKEEKVLRIIKYDANCESIQSPEHLLHQLQNEVSVIKNVIKVLLGEYLVNCPVIISLEAEDIKKLKAVASGKRPRKRTHKSLKDEKAYAVLLPDYCTVPPDLKSYPSFGPVISIEIKPKPGFLLKESFLENSLSKHPVLFCHFCRKQIYKMKVEGVMPKSSYCPTDLFSGCPKRMLHALQMLLDIPQNNIRIFKDQNLIYSEENRNDIETLLVDFLGHSKFSCKDRLCSLVSKILVKPLPYKSGDLVQFSSECEVSKCANAQPGCDEKGECHVLPVNCVLYRILRVQMLDKLDIQKVYPLFNSIKEANESDECIGCYQRSKIPPHLGELNQAEDETDYQFASRKVWEFIVALIAKDCSIMMVVKNYAGGECNDPNLITDDFGKSYLFSIAVADLDTKPLSRIEKHYRRTPHWLQSCLSLPV